MDAAFFLVRNNELRPFFPSAASAFRFLPKDLSTAELQLIYDRIESGNGDDLSRFSKQMKLLAGRLSFDSFDVRIGDCLANCLIRRNKGRRSICHRAAE